MSLHLPDPALLEPSRVGQILRDLGFPEVPGFAGWVHGVASHCLWVREVPGQPVPTWSVREAVVRHRPALRGQPIATASLVCSCAGHGCAHAAAVLVVLAFNDPRRGAALRAPAWEVALAPLTTDAFPASERHRGHVRYALRRPAPGEPGLGVEAALIRYARTDGAPLKPSRYPRTVEELKSSLLSLAPVDIELHPALTALARARQLERGRRPQVSRQLSRAILEPLSRAGDVRLEGKPVIVSAVPVRPRLRADRNEAGGLDLVWDPPIRLHWADAGVVLTEGRICPLPDDLSPQVAERLLDPLPAVPGEDVERFVDTLVVGRHLDVVLPQGLERVHEPDGRQARLALHERPGHVLEVRLDLAYARGEGEVVVGPETPGPTVLVPERGLVRRHLAWENAERDRFRADIGADFVRHLEFEDALAFLERRLPDLASTWEVFGHDGLVGLTVRGDLLPTVRFTEAADWFDLDVGFELGGRRIDLAEVLQSWLQGLRYHRLDDGSLARLPSRWLERHGARVDWLAEVRRASKRLGAWHAWVAQDLLDEVGGPAARWLGWVQRLQGDHGVPERSEPPGLLASLRPYQRRGVDWLLFLRDHGLHGVLADEMGLGKTLQALAVLLHTPRDGPSLVVAPTSVVHGWCDEARRFAPGLRILAWHGPDRDPAAIADADLVVTSYALLRRDQATLEAVDWLYVVLDEAQHIKNPASLTARAARRLRAKHRVALSGTPLENDLVELWSLFAFLMPGYLGRRSPFQARYGRASRDSDAPAVAELSERIRPFLLRRRKTEVAPELPQRTDVTVRVPLSDRERRLYDSVRLTMLRAIEAAERDPLRRRASLVLDGLTRLRQACCHPRLLPFPEARRVSRSSKIEALLEHLDEALGSGRRCLVFSQWTQLLDHVAAALDERDLSYLRLQGDTRDRRAVVEAFQREDGPGLFLISIKAGGTGLNLTAADTVFLLDPWWNPQVEDQATDRAHRIGQTRPVTVYRLVAADTVEDRVLRLQEHKRRLFEQTVERTALDVASLTTEDLRVLLSAPAES